MASSIMYALRTVSGNSQTISDKSEEALQTFMAGTPVMFNAVDGGVQAWDGITVSNAIAGVSRVAGANLTTTGVAQQATFPGGVPNEASAQNISRPYFNDGKIPFEVAIRDNIFFGQIGTGQTLPLPGTKLGMTKDTDGHWYVDTTKTGAAAVVQILGTDYNDTVRGVHFVFLESASSVGG